MRSMIRVVELAKNSPHKWKNVAKPQFLNRRRLNVHFRGASLKHHRVAQFGGLDGSNKFVLHGFVG